MTTSVNIDKGGHMEEVLRKYFLDAGYFVVRGAKYRYSNETITDVDLWLYQRSSSFSRQRVNVDIKNKRTPQALERVLWTKGLQLCLRMDSSIVATTDTREAVKRFGELQNVTILDGAFLSKLDQRYGKSSERLSEELLTSIVRREKEDRIGASWIERIEESKSRLLSNLDFDGCNSLLNDARFFADQSLSVPHKKEAACRLFYLTCSFILIAIDFITREFAFSDKAIQIQTLDEGFRFGAAGKLAAEKVFSMAGKLIASYSQDKKSRAGDAYAKQFRAHANSLNVDILSNFIIKTGHGKSLFELGRSFEVLTYSSTLATPSELTSEQKSFIGALLDFFEIDRKKFFTNFQAVEAPPPKKAEQPEPVNSDAANLEDSAAEKPKQPTEQLEIEMDEKNGPSEATPK